MKVIILTSSEKGTAAHHLPYIIESGACEICMVLLCGTEVKSRKAHYLKKLRKIIKIGLLGALNGVRMRKWYAGVEKLKPIENIESICRKKQISFYRTPSINHSNTEELFKRSGAEVGISLGNGYIGKKIFSIPKYGMINIHHEMLPEYQNAQSIIWQLYNKSRYTGYTIHKINSGIDAGKIIYSEKVPITFAESLPDTIAKTSVSLLEASAKGLIHVLKNFSELFSNARAQGKGTRYTTPTFRQYLRIRKNFGEMKRK